MISLEDEEKLEGTMISELSKLAEIENVALHRKVCIIGKIVSVSQVEEVKSKSNEVLQEAEMHYCRQELRMSITELKITGGHWSITGCFMRMTEHICICLELVTDQTSTDSK